jgi:hypothetical protein
LCHLQHKLIGFYNRDEKCLLRGTNWLFKQSSLRFVFKGINTQSRTRWKSGLAILLLAANLLKMWKANADVIQVLTPTFS